MMVTMTTGDAMACRLTERSKSCVTFVRFDGFCVPTDRSGRRRKVLMVGVVITLMMAKCDYTWFHEWKWDVGNKGEKLITLQTGCARGGGGSGRKLIQIG